VIEALRRERARRAVAVLVELHAKRPAGPRGGARSRLPHACESRRRSRVA
jgi:hypothetical protein